jgi:hypothetical protein
MGTPQYRRLSLKLESNVYSKFSQVPQSKSVFQTVMFTVSSHTSYYFHSFSFCENITANVA